MILYRERLESLARCVQKCKIALDPIKLSKKKFKIDYKKLRRELIQKKEIKVFLLSFEKEDEEDEYL